METQEVPEKQLETNNISCESEDNSVCQTPEEQHRLLQLFEIFIEIDKNLKKQNATANNI